MVETDWETVGRAVPVKHLGKRTLRKLNLYLSLALHVRPGMYHKAFSSDTQFPLTFPSCLFPPYVQSFRNPQGMRGDLDRIRQTFPGTGSSLPLKREHSSLMDSFCSKKALPTLSSLLLKALPDPKNTITIHYTEFLPLPGQTNTSFPIFKTAPMPLL